MMKRSARSTTGWRSGLICYSVVLIVTGVMVIGIAIYSMIDEQVVKLRLMKQFDDARSPPNLLPLLAIICASLTILSTVSAWFAMRKQNQLLLGLFIGILMIVTCLWLGVGSWCISLQTLILDDMDIEFQRIGEESIGGSDGIQYLDDLSKFMPRISSKYNYKCCEGENKNALTTCSQQCGDNYKKLFGGIVFPCIFATIFGSGFICLIGVAISFVYCLRLDTINPAF